MPKVIVALIVTAVAVVLLAAYDTKPPRTVNPNSALKAQSADVAIVSGATYTSRSWKQSLQAAIDEARGG